MSLTLLSWHLLAGSRVPTTVPHEPCPHLCLWYPPQAPTGMLSPSFLPLGSLLRLPWTSCSLRGNLGSGQAISCLQGPRLTHP